MKFYNLTASQQNIINLQEFYKDSSISNQCGAVIFDECRNKNLLKKAICILIDESDALRIRLTQYDGIKQYIVEPEPETRDNNQYTEDDKWPQIELQSFNNIDELDLYANSMAHIVMPIFNAPLYKFVIFDLGSNKSGVLALLNHLISDAWSFSILIKRLDSIYKDLIASDIDSENKAESNTNLSTKDLPSYYDYIVSEEDYIFSNRYYEDKTFWDEVWSSVPEQSFIKPTITAESICATRITGKLSVNLTEKISGFCKEKNFSPAVLFETALLVYLKRINYNNSEVSIGIPVLNRRNKIQKKTVGMFISTLPVKVCINEDINALRLMELVSDTHSSIFRHERFPFSEILKHVRDKFKYTSNLYDVFFSFQNASTDVSASTRWYSNGCSEVPLQLHIDDRDSSGRYTYTVDYQTGVFQNPQEVETFIDCLEYILIQIINSPKIGILDIELVDKERASIFDHFNNTFVEYPKSKCVQDLFFEQVNRSPNRIALVFERKQYTYLQIDEMSNSLAHYLRENGLNRGDIVAIIAHRSWHIIVAILGVLKAGGAYMPVSPDYPAERIETMLEISDCRYALCYRYDKALSVNCAIDLESIDYNKHIEKIETVNDAYDLCYVIFTSGSTGKPKGVSITHANVSNLVNCNAINMVYRIIKREAQTIISVTNIIFDIFVVESLLPIVNGLTIMLANDEEIVSQKKLAALIESTNNAFLQTTPTKMRSYMMDKNNLSYLKKLKTIVIGGESFPGDLYTELIEYTDARIFNLYGPAETTVWSTNSEVLDEDNITIGQPIANTQIYILDNHQRLLPIGIPGELCIAGEGVGEGYINQPELTAERFIPNPFATDENGHGKILYRTGDLARWRMDGQIEYLGRIDTQVKIRGLRIELGEIESVMAEIEGMGLVAVAAKKDDTGRQYLAGYYTSDIEIDKKKIRRHLSEKLPKYMVPNYFMRLEIMPMTPSGKTDRKNLPDPDFGSRTEKTYTPPTSETEKILCGILTELFSIDHVGIDEDFFDDLGGDSLRAISYIAQAHEAGVDFPLQSIFDKPTVRELAASLTDEEFHVSYDVADFDKYKELLVCNRTSEDKKYSKHSLGNVFLTGATGFLGAHVLDSLMHMENGIIYCLIRGNDIEHCERHLKETLEYYFKGRYIDCIGKRIVVVPGDITVDNLSDCLPDDVQTVIHTAATVKHFGAYSYFHRINTEGTSRVVQYAKDTSARFFHISTISVSGNSMADDMKVCYSSEHMDFSEADLYIGQPLDNVYVRSKFEAERLVFDAIREGLDAHIIRVGNLTNRYSDLQFQPNYETNAFLKRIKAFLTLGIMPDYMMPLYAEFSPIDKTAEGVVLLAEYADEETVFHLYSNKNLYFDKMLEIFNNIGISMSTADANEFKEKAEECMRIPGKEFIFETLNPDMDDRGILLYDTNIHINGDFTVDYMKHIGFEWPDIDERYIQGYIEYFRKLGFLDI